MIKRLAINLVILSFIGLSATAQQNVTIAPGDDVVAILQTVVDVGSTITFTAGLFKVTPKEDETGRPDLMRIPPGTTVKGAGSGMDPTTATIIDCGFTFDSAIKIDDDVDGCTIEDLTVINTVDAALEFNTGSFDNTFNNVWALKAMASAVDLSGTAEAAFNFCVIGWSSGDVVFQDDSAISIFTNCDLFLGSGDIVEAEDTSELILLNCILFAGPGSNDIESDGGFITVANCVGWDPLDGDPTGVTATTMGRLDLNGGGILMDEDSIGEDPLYVAAPGMGFKTTTMDLHLQEGSPALTVGNTAFDADYAPTGDPTFAGSQGLAPVRVNHWSIF